MSRGFSEQRYQSPHKSGCLGLAAEDYSTDKVDVEGLYTGMTEVMVGSDTISQLFQSGQATLAEKHGPIRRSL